MNGSSKILNALIEITKRYEGLKLTAYRDPGGTWTIGYGHSGSC
ncbi:hypothetical protein Q7M76_04695 [Candidatus Liberibacter asiaticus]|uniref:Lysozyme n=1 Tax=Liberibacter asiaticus (strain psy62) TaxID=537021 RepID=C6XGM7_LIBAP|nr:hypothetical protein [Candidatus Liberibacter asiaticus]ACT57530.1 hypothetical protein CLIBASIA_04795 [Candidatus Liberibacter asiaticus str. psy62]KAE9511909.1 hypothetical protein FXW32_04610 [Candidatus Liberibacter asiaticus]KAE9514056.1 hypothetical protein FXW25_04500 [Candidatus Liberibacter asiaticus]KAE9515111.1 hypothetical protein FXW26_04535 [Candidatus Liberibacter asiaticus]KAE9517204.1 hypothetical protein FXW24_04630 [Candidatus Liberibacter asiaticus]